MKKYIILIVVICRIALLQAGNVMKISQYQVLPDAEIIIHLEVENNDPFVAFQADITIPEGFKYINNSATLNPDRISGHAFSGNLIDGNVLRLIGYSPNNNPFIGNDGVILSFSLKSGKKPGTFTLPIQHATLANSQSNNILTATSNGSVTVLSAELKLSTDSLNFYRVALGAQSETGFYIQNTGNQDLIISNFSFDDSQFSTNPTQNITITGGNSRYVSVKFAPAVKGNYVQYLSIHSNDPDHPVTKVKLEAIAYAVNELHTGNVSGSSTTDVSLAFSVNNMEAFTGIQFDINLPQAMQYIDGSAVLFRKDDHVIAVNTLNAHSLRVLAYSPSNKSFSLQDGKLMDLGFHLNGTGGYYSIGVSNVIISDAMGENIVSASYGGSLQITASDIYTSSHLSFGDVSMTSQKTMNLTVNNYGQEPLIISQLTFSNEYFSSSQILPLTINTYQSADIPIKFQKTNKGQASGSLKIFSNDPDEGIYTVNLTAHAFIPNYLRVLSTNIRQGETSLFKIAMENVEDIVAIQFDLNYPAGISPDLGQISLSDRKKDHVVSASAIDNHTIRIVAYSPTQKVFNDAVGVIVEIPFAVAADMPEGNHTIHLSNALMSNSQSENVMYEAVDGNMNVRAPNYPPVAHAGSNFIVLSGSRVTLDGSLSYDQNNDSLRYYWTAPEDIVLSSTTAVQPTFTAPFVENITQFVFSLIVNDGYVDSESAELIVTVKPENKVPVANAGENQIIFEGELVTLDGSASYDPDGDSLLFYWQAPKEIILLNETMAKPTFIAPEVFVDTIFKISLIVNDGIIDSYPVEVLITVKVGNKIPIAHAGEPQIVLEGDLVILDGSLSYDYNNDSLRYYWTAPGGIVLSSNTAVQPTFTAPLVERTTQFVFLLTVNDGMLDSEPAEVVIKVSSINMIGTGEVYGNIFHDYNANGFFDDGDKIIAEPWTIVLERDEIITITTETDSIGNFSFDNLPIGTYRLYQKLPAKWTVLHPYPKGLYEFEITETDNVVSRNFANFNLVRDNDLIEYIRFPSGCRTGQNNAPASTQSAPSQSYPITINDIPINAIHLNIGNLRIEPQTFYIEKNQIVLLAIISVENSTSSHILRFDNAKFSGILGSVARGEIKLVAFKAYDVNEGEIYSFGCSMFDHKELGEVGSMVIGSDPTVALKSPSTPNSTTIFPNPVINALNIQTESPSHANYEITNIAGQLFDAGSFTTTTQLNLSHLHSGIYLIKIVQDNLLVVRKFVKK